MKFFPVFVLVEDQNPHFCLLESSNKFLTDITFRQHQFLFKYDFFATDLLLLIIRLVPGNYLSAIHSQ